jgi:propionate catabolism operon transcriptional regulator
VYRYEICLNRDSINISRKFKHTESRVTIMTKILVVTHHSFSHLYYEVLSLIHLPLSIDILEIRFGEIDKIDYNMLAKYDLMITSGAHLEMINENYTELSHILPIYPLHFTEADLVKGLVKAKQYGKKVMVMYFPRTEFELEKYSEILDIDIEIFNFSSLDEAERLMIEHKQKGFNVIVGTSSVCEIAEKNGIHNVFIYSKDSLKTEIIKAYQFASMKNKMTNYAMVKEAMLQNVKNPILLLDQNFLITSLNTPALSLFKMRHKHELIGESFLKFMKIDIDKSLEIPLEIEHLNYKILIEPITSSASAKSYVVIISKESMGKAEKKSPTDFASKYEFTNIIHDSQEMKKVILKTKQYAGLNAPLLIIGESGTGKELIAHSIHKHSARRLKPFLPVNCSAIPQHILESELFGYEEGAFTGAKKGGKPGFFELAQEGTIFLDEIGEMPIEIQAKLLRVLQEKEIIRLGGNKIIPLNVRIITATNKDLKLLIKKNLFREDLYYRVNVLQIKVPSLRNRRDDIPLILRHLLIKYGLDKTKVDFLIERVKDALNTYEWHGNIRELENFAQRFCALNTIADDETYIIKVFHDVLEEFTSMNLIESDESIALPLMAEVQAFQNLDEYEKQKILSALIKNYGNKHTTAEQLGISRTTLWRKMKQYNISGKILK